jgi:2-keto-4-pentenoate hydratase/2-oxohepta-3-ene-1,7-dioic acid hydratase in catechol pathway
MTIEPMPSKILCVGKNYLDHAREMGASLPRNPWSS